MVGGPRDSADLAVLAAPGAAGGWDVGVLPARLADDLDGLVSAVRQQAPGAVCLVNVADEFFVAVRMRLGEPRLLLSDVGASEEWDLAAAVVAWLDLDVEDEDLDGVWPAGDMSIFADLGVDEMALGAILSDTDAYADELLLAIARLLGFGTAWERVVEGATR